MNSRSQIIATIGKSSEDPEVLKKMAEAGMDIARLNFSWGSFEEKKQIIDKIKSTEKETQKKIYILADLPGPRMQSGSLHTYDKNSEVVFTENDKQIVEFGIKEGVDFFAMSFVGDENDVLSCKDFIRSQNGFQKVIAKIERKKAVDNIDSIVRVADAVMVARGDLGNEISPDEIPFVQDSIIKKCDIANKPVIVATQMMLSMVDNPEPTRAEVSDVSNAISEGADAVMLSEETAKGNYPVEAVSFMEKIISTAESHLPDKKNIRLLNDVYIKETRGKLVIIRHQESEWNKDGLWTGSRDVHLTPYGFEESKELGELVKDICFDAAFASMQVRSIETLSSVLSVCQADNTLPTEHSAALNERDYGDYTGKNKDEIEKILGQEEFNKLRRGWDYPVPNGETLKMVSQRSVPFYLEKVVPLINNGKNVLLVSHGNTIRSLIKYIEKISDEDIVNLEMPFSEVLIYDLDIDGCMVGKEVRKLKNIK